MGMHRIAFVGAGELADIALLAAREFEIELVAVLDHQISVDQMRSLLKAPEKGASVDGVAITDFRSPQATFDLLREWFEDSQILAPSFLRVTRAPLSFKPKLARK